MKQYRKKPVVITAWVVPQKHEEPSDDLIELVTEHGWDADSEGIIIPTMEGDMMAAPGDYIIQGVAGEYYPCKPHIFEATYEEV